MKTTFCLLLLLFAVLCSFQMHYCDRRQPPGDEIYRKGNLSVFEVDGRASKVVCRLCSFAFYDKEICFKG